MKICFVYKGTRIKRMDQVILEYMTQNFSQRGSPSRSQIKNWISAAHAAVQGKAVKKAGFPVRPGSHVELTVPPEEQNQGVEPYDLALTILFEDQSLVVIDKPPGLTVHPGAGNKKHTLLNALVHYFSAAKAPLPEVLCELEAQGSSAPKRPGIVHRLDRDTSGVLVVAKTRSAQAVLARQFSRHSVGRAYLALAFCTPRAKRLINLQSSGTISEPLSRHPVNRKTINVAPAGGRGRIAITHWKIMEKMQYACLLELRLETGRTHQIRVHLNHIGSPVIGDKCYGNFSGLPAVLKRQAGKFNRQALHAYLLEFDHPVTGRRMSFNSALPQDMKELISAFRDYGRQAVQERE